MSAAELLVELDRQGLTLTPEGDGIRVTPASRLTAELRQAVRAHKAELLALLRPPAWDPGEADRLLAELRAEADRLRQDFGGAFPAELQAVVADGLAVAEAYRINHKQEAQRGWDPLQLLRSVRPILLAAVANCRVQLPTGTENPTGQPSRGPAPAAVLAHNGRLRWRPQSAVTPEERELLTRHKDELLKILPAPAPVPLARPSVPSAETWEQADALIASVQDRRWEVFGEPGWPPDTAACRRLWPLADAVDAAYQNRDLPGLRLAVAAFLGALEGIKPPGVNPPLSPLD